MKQLLVALIAAAFAVGAYAQTPAPKSDSTKAESMDKGDKKPAKTAKKKKPAKKASAKKGEAMKDAPTKDAKKDAK
jgi:hypothetical protein